MLRTRDHRQNQPTVSYLMLCLLILCSLMMTTANQANAETCEGEECIATHQLEIAVGLGLGVRTNPLYNSDNIPLIVIPDVAWYGENWYLDNTEVGYQWHWTDRFAFETFVALNTVYADFNRGNISNFVVDGIIDSSLSSAEEDAMPGVAPELPDGSHALHDPPIESGRISHLSPDDIADRDGAGDIGVRFHWYQENAEWTFAALHDVTSVHHGSQFKVQYKYKMEVADWRLISRLSLTWKSANLHDYYYGIDSDDIRQTHLHYNAGAGVYGGLAVSAYKKITENWSWLLHMSYQSLPDAMADSPLVDKKYTITSFAGVTYRF